MYCEHFGVNRPPFRITPDTQLFFTGASRGAVLDAMVYAISRGEGIIKVVGEVGSGKTMLCRMLGVSLPDRVEVVYLANPRMAPDDILRAIAFEMRLPLEAGMDRLQVMQVLQQRLLAMHAEDRQVVVFVEEAQGMPLETLEEIRLLSNLETQQHKLLQMVLFGQPELEEKIAVPEIRQLKERITHSFELPPFGARDVRAYLGLRMGAAGYRGPEVFSDRAIRRMVRVSQGLVRRVNILADKALLAAYASGEHRVTGRHVKAAASDSEFSRAGRRSGRRIAVAVGAVAASVAAGALVAANLNTASLSQWLGAGTDDPMVALDAAHTVLKLEAMAEARRPAGARPPVESAPGNGTQVTPRISAGRADGP